MVEEVAKNLRDFGASLARVRGEGARQLCAAGRLLRCGRVDFATAEQLGQPRTVVNFRVEEDREELPGVRYVHAPVANRLEKYDTSQKEVREWLVSVLRVLADEGTAYPVLVHCAFGRDRCGIVCAAVALALGATEDEAMAEFLLTPGAPREFMEVCLRGLSAKGRGIEAYVRGGVDLAQLRARLSGGD